MAVAQHCLLLFEIDVLRWILQLAINYYWSVKTINAFHILKHDQSWLFIIIHEVVRDNGNVNSKAKLVLTASPHYMQYMTAHYRGQYSARLHSEQTHLRRTQAGPGRTV